jgi:hypothetical protein
MADETLAQVLLDIVQQATHYRQLKKCANSITLNDANDLAAQIQRLKAKVERLAI